jgi:hypothetical protein
MNLKPVRRVRRNCLNFEPVFPKGAASPAVAAGDAEAIEAFAGALAFSRKVRPRMQAPDQELYRSSNGDRWLLVRDPATAAPLRHQPNRASGGQSSLMTIEDFLAEGHGPQQQALVKMIEAGKVPRHKPLDTN